VYEDTATVLFGMPGVRVVEAETERDGVTTVYLKGCVSARVTSIMKRGRVDPCT
jgi:hypothetical protein